MLLLIRVRTMPAPYLGQKITVFSIYIFLEKIAEDTVEKRVLFLRTHWVFDFSPKPKKKWYIE
jgi:hypothetical protein